MDDATILVADDHASLRMLIRRLLTRTPGWTVLEAEDGDEALALARDHDLALDLAILDQRMPGHTGTEVARILRAEGYTGPIVLFTAYLDPVVAAAARQLEVTVVEKSEIGELAEVAARALSGG